MTGLRVLIVEDERLIAEELCDRLSRAGMVVTGIAASRDEALRRLATDSPDLVLLDIRLKGGGDGVEVASAIAALRVPFVYVTAQADDVTLERAQRTRPLGYLLKPFDERTLRTTLALAIHESRERARQPLSAPVEQEALHRHLEEQAMTDSLTGLWNRRWLDRQLEIESRRPPRDGALLCLLLIDLDRFKPINDTYGHRAGDAALTEVGRRIRLATRPYDAVGRYGGDEFIVVLTDVNEQTATAAARRIHAAIAATPLAWLAHEIALSASLGVACVSGTTDAGRLVDAADQSLYAAKEAGTGVGPLTAVDARSHPSAPCVRASPAPENQHATTPSPHEAATPRVDDVRLRG